MIINPTSPALVSPDPVRSIGNLIARPPGVSADGTAGIDTASTARVDAQIHNLDQAQDNVAHAVSFTQTQDAYLQIVGNALHRMSDLAGLAADPATSDTDRARYQSEYGQLQDAIANASGKDFNGVSLFSGNTLTVALDVNGHSLSLPGADLSDAVYTDSLKTHIDSPSDASAAFSKVQLTITQLSQDHAGIGASQSELNLAADHLAVSKENLTALTIRLPDREAVAAAVQTAKQQILVQSDTATVAQANALPQRALRLVP